jgi:hypothetical protein
MYPYVNQKNQEKLKEGGYGTREFKDYTAHGLLVIMRPLWVNV